MEIHIIHEITEIETHLNTGITDLSQYGKTTSINREVIKSQKYGNL